MRPGGNQAASVAVDIDAIFADGDFHLVFAAGAFGEVIDAKADGAGHEKADNKVQKLVG